MYEIQIANYYNIGAILSSMSILKNLKQQTLQIIVRHTNELSMNLQQIQAELLSIRPSIQPSATYPHLNQVQSKQPELVYVSLTVQDILDVQYYYAFLISKPVSKESQIYILKYGANDKPAQNIDIDKYFTIMDSRQTLVCVSQFYGSKWVHDQWKGPAPFQKPVQLKIQGNHNFKLGQKINAVCVWNAEDSYLTFVRKATPQQTSKFKLNYDQSALKQEINHRQVRKVLYEKLQQFCSQPQALMTIFSMISEDPMFINNLNISQQLAQILPRVCHIKIKAPFKQSLFPYKNSDSKLIQTPMQLAMQKTYVVIDFSEFSNQKQIKINQQQIDNLKALKMFVEQGKTIYRWEYGESLNDHHHSGIIVKGSRIVNPHFYIGEQLIQKQKSNNNPFKGMELELKQKIRAYIQKCLQIKPELSQHSRKKIELDIDQQMKNFPQSKLNVQERMQIARLNSKSMGKTDIEIEDYILAKELLKTNN